METTIAGAVLALGHDSAGAVACVIFPVPNDSPHAAVLMEATSAEMQGTDLRLMWRSGVIRLLGVTPAVADAVRNSLPVVIISADQRAEVLVPSRNKVRRDGQ